MSKIYDGEEPYLFVSYSHKDKDVVESVIQLLQRQVCNIWYDLGITPGESWNDDIAKHLKNAKCFFWYSFPEIPYALNMSLMRYIMQRKQKSIRFLAISKI